MAISGFYDRTHPLFMKLKSAKSADLVFEYCFL